ncbi:MAG: hypothetical protein LBI18_10550, partial [Planctomycetaceae bacterium]|nr:hypothetical protein [Planctomycetaceae bacterium]
MKKIFSFSVILSTFLVLSFVSADEFSVADTNKDGVISKEEFNNYLAVEAVMLPPA